jgi:hypothetical protein
MIEKRRKAERWVKAGYEIAHVAYLLDLPTALVASWFKK